HNPRTLLKTNRLFRFPKNPQISNGTLTIPIATMATSSSAAKKYTLKSSDGETFEVSEAVATKSNMLKNMIDDLVDCSNDPIPLANVTGQVIAKVIEYCNKHVEEEAKEDGSGGYVFTLSEGESSNKSLTEWDGSFVKELRQDQDMLFDVILAANYMDIKGLFDLTCKEVAEMMKGKDVEEIRKIFHIKNDYTKEEEEEIRREYHWAFQ
ncbi:SKP1-like protein 4, partial [Linum grandiflorum]